MDVAAMVRDGISFLTHKATEGTSVTHAHYADALGRARAAGLKALGAYHVVRTPGNGGHGPIPAQVDFFLSNLDAKTPWWRTWPGFFLQVDLEHWPYDNVAADYGVQMCDQLKARTGKTVILYAPQWAYGNAIGGTHPLWASSYGANPSGHYMLAYPGDISPRWAAYSGRVPVILQYGSRLTIGSQPGMDANAFRGSLADLLNLVQEDDDMQFTDPVPSASGRNVGQVLSDLWCEEALGHSGFVPADKTARQLLLEEVRDGVRQLVTGGQRPAQTVVLTDADRTAIAAEVTAALGAKLDEVLTRLSAAGQALDG